MPRCRYLSVVGIAGMALILAGCDTLAYFSQAARGQWQVLSERQPIEEVIASPATAPEQKRKLALVLDARLWAERELHLNIGNAYTDYVALERPYVVWNVMAAPEFSIEPMQWCFPIAGCVAYRGYFSEADAVAYAEGLQAQGMETYVGGVEAYSTLGWFDDPVLSTFMRRSEATLVGLIFHELAHRTVYVQNDSTFNESFATVVELEGLKRWLTAQQQQAVWEQFQQQERYQEAFVQLILAFRESLASLYAVPLPKERKREEKQRLVSELKHRYQTLRDTQWQGYNGYDRWMNGNLNNAQVSTISTYHDYVPAFRVLLKRCENALPCFYARAEALASLDPDARKVAIDALKLPE